MREIQRAKSSLSAGSIYTVVQRSWLVLAGCMGFSVLLSVRSHDGSVYTMEIGNCYRSQLLPPQAVLIQLCCHCNHTIHTDQLDLFCKRQAGETKDTVVPTVIARWGDWCLTPRVDTLSVHIRTTVVCIVVYLRLKLGMNMLQMFQAFIFFRPVRGDAQDCTVIGLYCTVPFTQIIP